MRSSMRKAIVLCALTLPALVGCGRHGQMAPGAPLHVVPRIRIQHGNGSSPLAEVDSLSAVALDGDGNVIAGPIPLAILGTNFRGELEVPSGTDRRIRVRAFHFREEVYQGLSNPLSLGVNGTDSVEVLLRPAVRVALVPRTGVYVAPDSLIVDVVDTSSTGVKSLNLNISADSRIFRTATVAPGPDLPADGSAQLFFGRQAASGRARTSGRMGIQRAKDLLGELVINGGAGGLPTGIRRIARLTFFSYAGLDSIQIGLDSTKIRVVFATATSIKTQNLPIVTSDAGLRLRQSGLPQAVPVVSRFDTSNEGWTAVGDPVSPDPQFHATGGNPGGYISTLDAGLDQNMYFRAPAKFRGNLVAAYGRVLKFDQKESVTPNSTSHDVVLRGGGHVLFHDGPLEPGTDWTSFRIPLSEGIGWLDSAAAIVPTQAVFLATLSHVTSLDVLGEWFSALEEVSLDNVVFGDTIGVSNPGTACVKAFVTLGGNPVAGVPINIGGTSGTTASDGSFCFSAEANSHFQITARVTIGGVLYEATNSVVTFAPSACGGSCSNANLVLVAQQQTAKRYTILGTSSPNLAQVTGQVVVIVSDDSLGAYDTTAIITIQRDADVPVKLKNIDGGFYVASSNDGFGYPVVALDPGHLYTLRVDVEGDGQPDAEASMRMVSKVTISQPGAGSVQSAHVSVVWAPELLADSLFSFVTLDTQTGRQLRRSYNITSAQFDTVASGACTVHLVTTAGQYPFNFPGIHPNLLGPKLLGYWSSSYSPATIDFTVGSARGGRPPSSPSWAPVDPSLPRGILERLRKVYALAHPR